MSGEDAPERERLVVEGETYRELVRLDHQCRCARSIDGQLTADRQLARYVSAILAASR